MTTDTGFARSYAPTKLYTVELFVALETFRKKTFSVSKTFLLQQLFYNNTGQIYISSDVIAARSFLHLAEILLHVFNLKTKLLVQILKQYSF